MASSTGQRRGGSYDRLPFVAYKVDRPHANCIRLNGNSTAIKARHDDKATNQFIDLGLRVCAALRKQGRNTEVVHLRMFRVNSLADNSYGIFPRCRYRHRGIGVDIQRAYERYLREMGRHPSQIPACDKTQRVGQIRSPNACAGMRGACQLSSRGLAALAA